MKKFNKMVTPGPPAPLPQGFLWKSIGFTALYRFLLLFVNKKGMKTS